MTKWRCATPRQPRLSDDLTNVLSSVEIPIVLLWVPAQPPACNWLLEGLVRRGRARHAASRKKRGNCFSCVIATAAGKHYRGPHRPSRITKHFRAVARLRVTNYTRGAGTRNRARSMYAVARDSARSRLCPVRCA